MEEHFTQPNQVPVRFLLIGISAEIRTIRDSGYLIESAVGHIISAAYPEGPELAKSLQRLDHMVQSLEGIADFVEQLAIEINSSLTLDPTAALHYIKQRDLAYALIGRTKGEAPIAGDADFF